MKGVWVFLIALAIPTVTYSEKPEQKVVELRMFGYQDELPSFFKKLGLSCRIKICSGSAKTPKKCHNSSHVFRPRYPGFLWTNLRPCAAGFFGQRVPGRFRRGFLLIRGTG